MFKKFNFLQIALFLYLFIFEIKSQSPKIRPLFVYTDNNNNTRNFIEIQTALMALQRKLVHLNSQITRVEANLNQRITNLDKSNDHLRSTLDVMINNYKLTNKIEEAIQLSNFIEADRLIIEQKTHPSEIQLIVDHICNFDLIIRYAQKSESFEIRYNILYSLWIKRKQHTSIYDYCEIYKTFYNRIIDNVDENVDIAVKDKARGVCEMEIRPQIIANAAEAIKCEILQEDYNIVERSTKLIRLVFETNEEIFDAANSIAIDGAYEKVSSDVLLRKAFYEYPFPPNLFSILYIISKNDSIINSTDMSWIVNKVIGEKNKFVNENNLSELTQRKERDFIDILPENLKNLFRSSFL